MQRMGLNRVKQVAINGDTTMRDFVGAPFMAPYLNQIACNAASDGAKK